MRLLSLVLTLAIMAFLINKQLSSGSPSADIDANIDGSPTTQPIALPSVPSSPEDLEGFENDMQQLLNDLSKQRNQEMNKLENAQ